MLGISFLICSRSISCRPGRGAIMSALLQAGVAAHVARSRRAVTRAAFILIAVGFIVLFLLLPLITVFAQALSHGVNAALCDAFDDPDARSAIRLTLLVAAIAVPLNVVFGVAAAWAVTKFDFPARAFS
jgi:sulfate transport system permease protein